MLLRFLLGELSRWCSWGALPGERPPPDERLLGERPGERPGERHTFSSSSCFNEFYHLLFEIKIIQIIDREICSISKVIYSKTPDYVLNFVSRNELECYVCRRFAGPVV